MSDVSQHELLTAVVEGAPGEVELVRWGYIGAGAIHHVVVQDLLCLHRL